MDIPDEWTPPSTQGKVTVTNAWRIIRFGLPPGEVRLYVALSSTALQPAYDLIHPWLEEHRTDHRHARSGAVLQQYASHPFWAGKAVIIDPVANKWTETAQCLDQLLTGQGLEGTAALTGCRSYGGGSGLLFYRGAERAPEAPAEAISREQRLTRLLSMQGGPA